MIERTLSHYRILDEISRGGMGIVYRSVDMRLNREVALKVLPPELVTDPQRKRRFIQEAQAVAALNHPNIATVHEIDEVGETTFIVMERIEGETLRELLSRGPLPIPRALALASEIAEGLARAHQKGVVHRDLKPANVMVTHDGHAKIIDFGLAKLVETLEPSADGQADAARRSETRSGVVMGTVSYMSPEQARGDRVDRRTDIFTFGTLLYEMFTGTNPFERGNAAETISAILTKSPLALSASRRDLSTDTLSKLQRIVDQCLSKDREERYRTINDLLADLKRIPRDSESEAATRTARRPIPAGGRRPAVAASLFGALLIGTLAYLVVFRHERVPVLSNPIHATRAIGAEAYPTWSPEGGRLAYHLDTKGDGENFDVWVGQVGPAQAVNLTETHSGNDLFPSWSPDGNQIAFWSDRQGGGYFVMSALGGPARKVTEGPSYSGEWRATRAQWSPDGRELASVSYEKGAAFVRIVSIASGGARQLALPGQEASRLDLSWSPDGRYLAYLDAWNTTAQVTELRVLRIEDGDVVSVTDGRTNVWSPSWSRDARHLYFVSNRGGSMDLWRQRLEDGRPDGEPERVTTGMGLASAALSSDGKRLAYSRGRVVSNVWRVPILKNRPATWADAQQISFDEAYIETLDVSQDGGLLISSDRSGNPDLWMLPVQGGAMQQVTTDPTPDWAPAWSPDGQQIAFYAYRTGNREIWVQPVAGGPARQLTESENESAFPAWSPDGQDIVFHSAKGGNVDIWRMPASGGQPSQVTMHPADDWIARWSPDGDWLAFVSTRSGSSALWRARADGGEAELLVEGGFAPRWSRKGERIYYVSLSDPSRNIWEVAVREHSARPMTDFRGRRGSPVSFALATDDSYLYFAWQEDLGDIWVADVTNH